MLDGMNPIILIFNAATLHRNIQNASNVLILYKPTASIISKMHRKYPHAQKAFTLVEIAIVMAVIGLIVAGVTIGRSLAENAALQSVVADFDMYRKAALSYRDKYKALPGDHTAATGITSAAAGCPTPSASDAAATATCNGDGDGIIGNSTGNPLGAFSNYHESLLAWQHLMNAGMISGTYNGRATTATNQVTANVNVPASKIGNASFMLRYFPTNTVTSGYFKTDYGHVFFFGQPSTAANLPFTNAALTTEQAKSIDLKIDDGKPGLGKVLTLPASVRPCPTTSAENTAIYDSSLSDIACSIIFISGF